MAQGRSTKIISMIEWTRTSRLLIKISLSVYNSTTVQLTVQLCNCKMIKLYNGCTVSVSFLVILVFGSSPLASLGLAPGSEKDTSYVPA